MFVNQIIYIDGATIFDLEEALDIVDQNYYDTDTEPIRSLEALYRGILTSFRNNLPFIEVNDKEFIISPNKEDRCYQFLWNYENESDIFKAIVCYLNGKEYSGYDVYR